MDYGHKSEVPTMALETFNRYDGHWPALLLKPYSGAT